MRNIETYAQQAPAFARAAWQDVAVPAARAMRSHARGQYAVAVDELGRALPRLTEIGGSHAQRDLFAQVHADALARSGRFAASRSRA